MKYSFVSATRIVLSGLVLSVNSCNQISPAKEMLTDAKPEITKTEMDSLINLAVIAFNKGDMKSYTDFFATDGVSLGPEGPPIVGRKDIFEAYDNMYKSGITGVVIRPNNFWIDHDLSAVDGTWSMSNNEGVDVGKGKFVWLMKKENNEWKILRDIYNYDMPQGASKN